MGTLENNPKTTFFNKKMFNTLMSNDKQLYSILECKT
jgi:hypothetical protein